MRIFIVILDLEYRGFHYSPSFRYKYLALHSGESWYVANREANRANRALP
jgi:hypothetical protein